MESIALERYRQRLLDTRTRLTIETERMSQNLREKATVAGDLSNLPDHNADRDTEGLDAEIAVERNERKLLAQVQSALQRIQAGSFGHCEDCGEEISYERLDVIPYTPYCVDCSRRHETAAF